MLNIQLKKYIVDSNWAEVSPRLKKKSLKLSVLQYKEICGEALKGKKKDETVVKTNRICQVSIYTRYLLGSIHFYSKSD